jgi:thiamine-monophosphate kinase
MTEHELIRAIRALLEEERRAAGLGARGPAEATPWAAAPGAERGATSGASEGAADTSGVVLGPGDDCAVLAPSPGCELLLTTDAAVEGVHFLLPWMDAETAGRRAMAANVSDVAAMAGRPRWALLALALPAGTPPEVTLALVRGAAREAALHGASLVGGNLSRASGRYGPLARPAGGGGGPHPQGGEVGSLSLTITVAGEVPAGRAVRRSGARAGDALYVTGEPGLARAGLLALERGLGDDPALAPCVERFRRPRPRARLAPDLRDRALARAMIDVSDGLVQDLGNLAAESGAGALLEEAGLRAALAPALLAAAERLGEEPLALALAGGEDYELLFAAPPGSAAAIAEVSTAYGVAISRIGAVDAARGIRRTDGTAVAVPGYDHFAERG